MNSTHPLILGSNSPRRKQILADAGYDFTVMTLDIDESYPTDLEKKEIAAYLSKLKNKAYRERLSQEVLLTADTTVILNDESLEKPANKADAIEMLAKLSGKNHQVITGFCISNGEKTMTSSVSTDVFFKTLTFEEIEYYVNEYRPYDKAGAYGIQEWIGLIGIERIEGSYFNVVGLPIFEISEALKTFDLTIS